MVAVPSGGCTIRTPVSASGSFPLLTSVMTTVPVREPSGPSTSVTPRSWIGPRSALAPLPEARCEVVPASNPMAQAERGTTARAAIATAAAVRRNT